MAVHEVPTLRRAIRFAFSLEKLIHSLAFFASAGVPDLTKLKAAKLLYFADKDHLLEHGRPILGDVYFCIQYGPVPSVALNEMNDAIETPEVESDAGRLAEALKVHKPLLGFGGHPTFQLRGTFDESVFSIRACCASKNG